jgi:hypothetical protein
MAKIVPNQPCWITNSKFKENIGRVVETVSYYGLSLDGLRAWHCKSSTPMRCERRWPDGRRAEITATTFICAEICLKPMTGPNKTEQEINARILELLK